jgi:hypothetical protein
MTKSYTGDRGDNLRKKFLHFTDDVEGQRLEQIPGNAVYVISLGTQRL